MKNNGSLNVLNFESGSLRGAVELGCVHKIIALPRLTPINDAPIYVVGLINYSGKIVPIIDMVIKVEDRKPERYHINTPIILCDTANGKMIGLLVNKVINIANVDNEMMEKCELSKCKMFASTIKYNESIATLINVDCILSKENDD